MRKPKRLPHISIILKEVLYRWVQYIVIYSYVMILFFLFRLVSLNLAHLGWFERSLSTSQIIHTGLYFIQVVMGGEGVNVLR